MKHQRRNPIRISTTLGAALLASTLLSSCGSGGSAAVAIINAGIGGTGIVFGTITGFGSVWVNGRRFEIDGSEIIVDGELKTQDELKIGMVVRLDVDTENGMFGGTAARVVFDDAIQGPLNGAPIPVVGSGGSAKRFKILEQYVTIDANRTLFNGTDFGFATIADDDVVEVSGFRTAPDEIVATYVRKVDLPPTASIEVEFRGTIQSLMVDNFKINGVTVNLDTVIEIDVDGGQLEEGMLVEVEGFFVSDTEVDALKIEAEDEDFGEAVDEISLQGIVSGYSPTGAGLNEPFFINGQLVDASGAEREPENIESLMQNGLEVEVEGEIVNGILIAEELELRDGDTEVRATVFSKDPSGSFVVEFPVGKLTITTNGITVFEDESETPIPGYSFQDLAIGHFVEVEGVEVEGVGSKDTLSAQVVKRRKPNDLKLQGVVDEIDSTALSITILDLTYPMDSDAIYEENPTMTATEFFDPGYLMVGDIVELEDNHSESDPADGFADAAETDD